MTAQKLKIKKKSETITEHAKETARIINGEAGELQNKMFHIGEILVQRYKDAIKKGVWLKSRSKGAYYELVANEMKSDLATNTLYECALLAERIPDFTARRERTGLGISHYQELARVKEFDSEERFEELEQQASEEGWTRDRLRNEIRPPVPDVPDYERQYHGIQTSLTNFETEMDELGNNFTKLSQQDREDLARSLFVTMTTTIPNYLKKLMDAGIIVDENMVNLVKKIRGDRNEEA